MIKSIYGELPQARRAAKELETHIKKAVPTDKQKKVEEVLAKFEEEARREQTVQAVKAVAERLKLYHGIK